MFRPGTNDPSEWSNEQVRVHWETGQDHAIARMECGSVTQAKRRGAEAQEGKAAIASGLAAWLSRRAIISGWW